MSDDYNPLKIDDYELIIHGYGDAIDIEGGGGAISPEGFGEG